MIVFPEILAHIADDVGMKHPFEPENWISEKENFPHFFVFCAVQLGSPMPYPSAPRDNCEIIAKIDGEKLKTLTFEELETLGVNVNCSSFYS